MRSFILISFLLLLVSLGARADMACKNIEVLVDEDKILRYQDCGNGHSQYNFTILSNEIGQYECDKVNSEEQEVIVQCSYKVCTKADGFFANTQCEKDPNKELTIEL